jgi:hypothetical protein
LLALDAGETRRYGDIMQSTLGLSRHVFSAPTANYKTGIVFMAYLNGHQDRFRMIGGLEGARSMPHLAQIFVLADRAGLLRDPELASYRVRGAMAAAGVEG